MQRYFSIKNGHVRFITVIFVLLFVVACKKNTTESPPPPPPAEKFFIRGLDLSFTPEISSYNISFSEDDTVKPILQIAKDKGINTIRVRLWYAPPTVHSSLSEVLDFAKQIKQYGFKFWLDIHYSDTWCDPAHQAKPAAWSNLSFDQLKDSLSAYTTNVLTTLNQNNATPDFVQIGNETNNGMLWPDGMIYTSSGEHWDKFMELFERAATAVKGVLPNCKVILHYAGYTNAVDYFSNLILYQSDFDMIGLSYYPPWHGKVVDSVGSVIQQIHHSLLLDKPVVIAETSYPWTLGWNDWTNNLVGLQSQLIPSYTATDTGQANYLSHLISVVKSEANDDNFGVCYWAADWVAFKGATATDGSTWENQTLFNFQYKSLPALDTLGKK